MPFQFGTVFSQAMQNALAAENQKKKDVYDYNMNVDKLNLDKWNSYNSLNLDAYRANQEGKRWGEEMKLKVDDTNWQRQFDTKKFNTDLDIVKNRDFMTVDPNMYKQAYGIDYTVPAAPGLGGLVSVQGYNAFGKSTGEAYLNKAMERERLDTQKWVAGLQASTQTSIAQMEIQARKDMALTDDINEKKRIQDGLDVKANATLMILLDEKGNVIDKVNPDNYEDLKQLQRMRYISYDLWGGSLSGTLKNMPSPIKKTKYPGTKDAIRNAVTGSSDN